MSYCTACGTELAGDAKYCTRCGEPRSGDATADGSAAAGAPSRSDPRSTREAVRPEGDETPGAEATRSTHREDAEEEVAEAAADGKRQAATPTETRGRQLSFLGAAVTAVGTFLPWLTVEWLGETRSWAGIDGDGQFSLAAAVIVTLLLLVGRGKRWAVPTRMVVVGIAVLTAAIPALYINDPAAGTEEWPGLARDLIEPGIGLYVTLAGAILMGLGPLWASAAGRE